MVKKFSLWFTCFGLGLLFEICGWGEQEEAFLIISFTLDALVIALVFLYYFFTGNNLKERFMNPLIVTAYLGEAMIGNLFATFVAVKLFNVNYYAAFQIMSFGMTLGSTLSAPKTKRRLNHILTQKPFPLKMLPPL